MFSKRYYTHFLISLKCSEWFLLLLLPGLNCHNKELLSPKCLILEPASELESDLRDTVDWGRIWFVDFNTGKTQLVWFDRWNNTGSIFVKMNGSVIEEKPSFKMLGLNFLSKLDWGYYIISIGNIASAPDFCAFFEKTFLNLFFIVAVPRTAVQPTSSEEKIPISLWNLFVSRFLIRNWSN